VDKLQFPRGEGLVAIAHTQSTAPLAQSMQRAAPEIQMGSFPCGHTGSVVSGGIISQQVDRLKSWEKSGQSRGGSSPLLVGCDAQAD